jgi:hypothetical protein
MNEGEFHATLEPVDIGKHRTGVGAITNISLEPADGNLYTTLKIRVGNSVQHLHLTLTPVEGGDIQTRSNPDGRFLVDDPTEDYQFLEIDGKRYHAYATPHQR